MVRQRLLNFYRCQQRAIGMVFIHRRDIIGNQHSITLKLVNDAAVLVDDSGQQCKIFIQQTGYFIWVQFLAKMM